MRCEGYAAGSEATLRSRAQTTRDNLLQLLFLPLAGGGLPTTVPPVARRQRSPSWMPRINTPASAAIVTTLSADAQLHEQTAAFRAWTPAREVKGEVDGSGPVTVRCVHRRGELACAAGN